MPLISLCWAPGYYIEGEGLLSVVYGSIGQKRQKEVFLFVHFLDSLASLLGTGFALKREFEQAPPNRLIPIFISSYFYFREPVPSILVISMMSYPALISFFWGQFERRPNHLEKDCS